MSVVGNQIRSATADAEHARDIAPLVHCPPGERDLIRWKLALDRSAAAHALWRVLEQRWRGVDAGRPWMAVKP